MDKSVNSERTEPGGSSLHSGPVKLLPQTPPLPVKVLIVIISLILYMFVPALVLLSCNFISVMQAMLYSDVDKRDDWNPDVLWIFLITQQDLTSFMPTLHVHEWSSVQAQAHLIPCVLARMDNLCSLSINYQSPPLICKSCAAILPLDYTISILVPCRWWWQGVHVTDYTTFHHSYMYLLPPCQVSPVYSSCLCYCSSHLLQCWFRMPSHIQMPICSQILPYSSRCSAYCGHSVPKFYTHRWCSAPNITVLQGWPYLINLLVLSHPPVSASITISTMMNHGFGMS